MSLSRLLQLQPELTVPSTANYVQRKPQKVIAPSAAIENQVPSGSESCTVHNFLGTYGAKK